MTQFERDQIKHKVHSLSMELQRLDLKIQTFTEVIAHLRSRVLKADRRKREIHFEINDLKEEVRALEAEDTALPVTDPENDNNSNNNLKK